MYRCTECKAEYTELPEFCDCGNDSFEEIYENDNDNDNYYYEEEPKSRRYNNPRKRLTKEEYQELQEEKADKTKSIITFSVAVLICIILLICPPHLPKRTAKPKIDPSTKVKVEFPKVDQIWIEPNKNAKLPLLNSRLSNLTLSNKIKHCFCAKM